ncbi:MAG: hypothetical protein ACOY0T_34965 [Myxococcota bacterium]
MNSMRMLVCVASVAGLCACERERTQDSMVPLGVSAVPRPVGIEDTTINRSGGGVSGSSVPAKNAEPTAVANQASNSDPNQPGGAPAKADADRATAPGASSAPYGASARLTAGASGR